MVKPFNFKPFKLNFEPETLVFSFWNTSLTPPVAKCVGNTPQDKMDSALEIIGDILKKVDFLGLCEVHNDNLEHISNYLKGTEFTVMNLILPIGKTWFDLAVIYNKKKLSVTFEAQLKARYGQQGSLKSAVRLSVKELQSENEFHVFISHWKSRLSGSEEERRAAAVTLRNSIHDSVEQNKSVILMGDYNDGPFNQSIFCDLAAGKCFDATKSYPKGILYNPFSRLSFNPKLYSYLNDTPSSVGTYYIKGAKTEPQHFFIFDQIIFSADFLGLSDWHLEESKTGIIQHDTIQKTIYHRKKIFDHYPVIATIIKPIWR